jgi:hypothetical protein
MNDERWGVELSIWIRYTKVVQAVIVFRFIVEVD